MSTEKILVWMQDDLLESRIPLAGTGEWYADDPVDAMEGVLLGAPVDWLGSTCGPIGLWVLVYDEGEEGVQYLCHRRPDDAEWKRLHAGLLPWSDA